MPFESDATIALPDTDGEPPASDGGAYAFEGHVDFFGFHAPSQGWFFGGWLTHPWPVGNRPGNAVAHFTQGTLAEGSLWAFYHRADVERRGIGFVFFAHAPAATLGRFVRLSIEFARTRHDALPSQSALLLTEAELTAELQPILAGGEDGSQRRGMLELLLRGRRAETNVGFIDCYGYHAAAGGWLFCGWVSRRWPERQPPERIVVAFEQGEVGGEAIATTYARSDLQGGADGAMFFVQGSAHALGGLCSLSYEAGGVRATLFPGAPVQRLREADLLARLRPVLALAVPGLARDSLLALLARQPYAGQDTLAALNDPVFLEIDAAIVCEPDGLLLIGWCLAGPGVIRGIRVRGGTIAAPLDLRQAITVDRPDVLAALAQHGFDESRCGFIAFVPDSVPADERIYLEVETTRREVGFRAAPRPRLTGMAAIRRVLECLDARFADVPRAFDRVIGPALQMLNRERLKQRPGSSVVDYGTLPAEPTFSVIVPLYGRLDFVEYQLALFSAHPGSAEVEFIYVLDDPAKRTEAQLLFASAYERFGVAFRAILLDRNVGYAPANNIGLRHARAETVAFLNSDVFPATPDWLERLTARLVEQPTLGVVGALLLFEDGSVQHQGMYFTRLRAFGNWFFPQHDGKGLRPGSDGGLRTCISITGACMVMRRELARRVGGFDEIYAIGDFEDSDLCLKLQALGYDCAVDRDVRMYHLERKSQATSALGWRLNLTLYNAWQHERRWGATIAAQPAPGALAAPRDRTS
jgi:GT2 family glycosyltransferase